MHKINLVPLSIENKQHLKDEFYEEVNINEILCYENIVYRDGSNDVIFEDTIAISKVSEFGKIPESYEERQDEEVYFSYALTLPIFSLQENIKFINLSSILKNSIYDIEEYFYNTDNLLIAYSNVDKTFYCTIAEKEEVLEYKNEMFKKYLLIDEDNFDRRKFQELIDESCIMTNILNRCAEIIQETEEKYDNYAEKKMCLPCVKNSFRDSGNDTYSCLEKLAHYTIYYGPMYVSEIYHFLRESHIIENNFLKLDRPINIISLGCGFGPDNIALHKHKKDKWLDVEFNYKGYDIEPLWGNISSAVMHNFPEIKNIVEDDIDCSEADIIFMNKVFSTLKKNDLHDSFLDNFQSQLDDYPIGSLIVYNDINHINEGRDIFKNFMQRNSFEIIGKYFFDNSGYNDNYTVLESSENVCEIPHGLPCESKTIPAQLVFIVYQKVE